MIFWREKEEKNCACRFEAKKSSNGVTTVPERAIVAILAFSGNKW
jgi:hypothetical protein